MAIEYASKYSTQIDERFREMAFTNSAVNQDYDWLGVQSIKVYSVSTAPMNSYTMTGANRYGVPDELSNSTQEMILSQDKSFTFTVDKRNNTDTMGTLEIGRALSRQIDEVIVPMIDKYRVGVMAANAGGTNPTPAPITQTTAYEAFLDATAFLTENSVPEIGRVCFVTPTYYKMIKLDGAFIKPSEMAQDMLIRGVVGMIDGVPIVNVPTSYFPPNVAFLITNAAATVGPVKLSEYKIHDNPPGVNGWLAEGRVYYDAFVLNNKKNAIYVYKNA